MIRESLRFPPLSDLTEQGKTARCSRAYGGEGRRIIIALSLHYTATILHICTALYTDAAAAAARKSSGSSSELLGLAARARLARAARRAPPCAAYVPFGLNLCLSKTTNIFYKYAFEITKDQNEVE